MTGGMKDPGRAAPLDDSQYAALAAALRCRVMPVLQTAAAELKRLGFPEVRVTRRGGMASLFAGCPSHGVEARLRFQIHDTFAPLVTSEPIFWMATVYRTTELLAGKPGRLGDFDEPGALEKIVADFVESCTSTLNLWKEGFSVYFKTIVSRAVEGKSFVPPPPGANIPVAEWNGESLCFLVLPSLEAARGCLVERFPHVESTVEGPPSCRFQISTPSLKNTLRFFAECPEDGVPLLFCESEGDHGRIPPHSIPIARTASGFCIRQHQLYEVVGEFLYASAATLACGPVRRGRAH
jgi:hypothetical protein